MAELTPVGSSDEVSEGGMRRYEVAGKEIAVARVDGRFYAFSDICSHQRCHLSDGELEDRRVVCICHGSEFDVATGEVMNPPATEPIPVYEVRTEDGELKVGL